LSFKELENGKKPSSRKGDAGSKTGTSNGEVVGEGDASDEGEVEAGRLFVDGLGIGPTVD